ncbi:MAG: hypothetical protein ACRD5K_20180, partial [Candidatus Acidiferrales bacterium]
VTIVCAVLLATIVAHYDEFLPYRWHTFKATDGSFTAQFPSNPKVNETQVRLVAGGTTTLDQITAKPQRNTVYTFSYFDDPRLANGPAEKALNSARDGSVSRLQGTVISDHDLEVDGYPALDVEIRARADSLVAERLIAVRHRMLLLVVVETDRTRPDSKNIQRFFDSIKISPQ